MPAEFSGIDGTTAGPIRVLHVEDDPSSADLTATHLERENDALEVVGERSVSAALARLDSEGEAIDCVVSDYDMSEESGLALLEAVRETRPDLPFVLFTGTGSEAVASEAISAGVDDYLQKGGGDEQYELLATRIATLVGERRARRALDRREARFRSLFENIPDSAVIVEYEAGEPVVRAVNEAFEETFGVDGETARGGSLNELIVPRSEREAAASLDSAVRSGERIEREVRRRTADGEVRDFLLRTATIAPVEADTGAHFGVYTDVTPLRERERELELYQAIVDGAPDAIYALDEDEEFVLVNDVLATVLGLSKDDLLGKPVTHLVEMGVVDEDTVAPRLDQARAALAGETDQLRFEATATVGGERVITENHVSVVRDDRRGASALVNVVRDVTERRDREEQLRRQNARLEEFASVVSHDLRNPLNVAAGNVQLARETGDLDRLEEAERALDRMERLVRDLLTLARQGQTVEETRPVELAVTVRDAWTAAVDDGKASLDVDLDGVVVRADPGRLRQVLENLLTNAIDHGGPKAAVRVGLLGDRPGFFVADDGPGVAPAEAETVFEHGYTTSADGTGFGLSIVRGIVEAHGWTIEAVESTSGGARFEIAGVELIDGA